MTTPVKDVNGIGPKTAAYLKARRVTTAEGLLRFGIDNLARAPGIGQVRAQAAIDDAKQLLGQTKITTNKSAPVKTAAKKSDSNKNKKAKKDKKKDKKNKKDKKKDKKEKKKNKKDKKKNK